MYHSSNGPLGPAAATGIVGGVVGWEIFYTQLNNIWLWLFFIAASFTLLSAIGAAREVLPSTYGLQRSFMDSVFGRKPLAPIKPSKKRYLPKRK